MQLRLGVGLSTIIYDDGFQKHPNGGNGNGISGCHPLYVFGGLKLDWSTKKKAGIHSGSYIYISHISDLSSSPYVWKQAASCQYISGN